jgi:hypothetical protein
MALLFLLVNIVGYINHQTIKAATKKPVDARV